MANDWGWPFSGGYKGYEEGQQFGITTFDRTGNGDYFHDGFDFGSARYPGSNISAVHAGTVVYSGMAPAGYGALGTVVVTKDSSGYYVVYQEFGTSTSNISDTHLEIEEVGFFYKKNAKKLVIMGTQALVDGSAEIPCRVAPMSKAMYIFNADNIVNSVHNEWGKNVRIKGYVRDSVGNVHFSKKRFKV